MTETTWLWGVVIVGYILVGVLVIIRYYEMRLMHDITEQLLKKPIRKMTVRTITIDKDGEIVDD